MEGKTLLRRMVNRDGSADFKRKERYKQQLESVGTTQSDDLCMRGDGRRFGDAMSLWQRIEYGNIFGYFTDRPGTGSLQLVSIGLCEDCQCFWCVSAKATKSAEQAHEAWIRAYCTVIWLDRCRLN